MAAKKSSGPKAKKESAKKGKAVKPKKARGASPHSGQSGPALELTSEKLNEKESHVIHALAETLNPMSLNELAATCWSDKASSEQDRARNQANSWVRNSLRRLVRGQWVEKVGKGTYRLSDIGRAKTEASTRTSSGDGSSPA